MERIAHQGCGTTFGNQYTIAYTPTNLALDGTFRPDQGDGQGFWGILSRALRSGYYATPEKAQTEWGVSKPPKKLKNRKSTMTVDPDSVETA